MQYKENLEYLLTSPKLPSTERYRPGEIRFSGGAYAVPKVSQKQGRATLHRDLGYYTVFDGKQEHEVLVALSEEEENKWVSLGIYECKKKKVSVTLSDKRISDRRAQTLVADAVKWLKVN